MSAPFPPPSPYAAPPPSGTPGPYGAPPSYGPPWSGSEPTATNRWAVVSLVAALVGLVPVGIAAGAVALTQVGRRNESGRGLAIAGIAVSIGVAFVAAVVGAAVLLASEDDGFGKVQTVGTARAVAALDIGDCFAAVAGRSDSVRATDCAGRHDGELFLTGSLAEDYEHFPGDEEVAWAVDDQCYWAFEEYVGRDYDSSAYDYAAYGPDEQSWAEGDRATACSIMPLGVGALEGSARGSGR